MRTDDTAARDPEWSVPFHQLTPVTVSNSLIRIHGTQADSDELLIDIRRDGTSVTGPNFDPDAAAQTFLDAVLGIVGQRAEPVEHLLDALRCLLDDAPGARERAEYLLDSYRPVTA